MRNFPLQLALLYCVLAGLTLWSLSFLFGVLWGETVFWFTFWTGAGTFCGSLYWLDSLKRKRARQ